MAMQQQSYDIVTMQHSVANSMFVQKKSPGMALSFPQLCCCSMAASLSPPECFQGEIAMLELISGPRTKSCSVASYWLSVRRDSAPSTLTTKPTKHDHLSFNGRPMYANTLSLCLSLSFSLFENSVIQIDRRAEGCNTSHKTGLKTYSSISIVFPLSSLSFLWV